MIKTMRKSHLVLFVSLAIILIVQSFGIAYGIEPIKITISDDLNQIVFDGKWTQYTEWKKSSLNTFTYNDTNIIQFRSAHQDNFIYFLIDFITDIHPDNNDKAMICLDTRNDKSSLPDQNDYCFLAKIGENQTKVLQGTSNVNFLTMISPPEGLITIGNKSDENDRYSKIPHSSYEFRIPTDFVSRQSEYGIFVAVYDSHTNKTFTWPQENLSADPFNKPIPAKWGDMISPDKSLPEFHLPMVAMILTFIVVIYFSKKNKF